MFVQGSDCSIVIKTSHLEKDIPYSDETIREAVSILKEEASIDGDGVCRCLRKSGGVTGCVVTPLTIGTAPLLLYLAMGSAGSPLFVSETRNLYQYRLDLLPMEDTKQFDLIQDRGRAISNEQLAMSNERRIYEGCRVKGFELRIFQGEAVKLKLDIFGECAPKVYTCTDTAWGQASKMNDPMRGRERFNSDLVTYSINGKEYKNIYGFTLLSKKIGGTRTELWIKRALQQKSDIPELIEELCITAFLMRDVYELRQFGTFRITLKRLVFVSDETEVNASGAIISPLHYYVAGETKAEVFTAGEECLK
jgi:hypothetical protein